MTLREKRLRICHGHMLSVPPARIELRDFGMDLLTGVGHDQPCSSAGCVHGHIQTIPEFREWEIKEYGHHSFDIKESVDRTLTWLRYARRSNSGLLTPGSPDCGHGMTLFGPGTHKCKSTGEEGKQEAIRRLEFLIAQEQAAP